MLETLDHTIRIGSTPTFLYFDLYNYLLGHACSQPVYNVAFHFYRNMLIMNVWKLL